MKTYLSLLTDILTNGKVHHNRTGVDTLAVFGRQLRFGLSEGFPILTTKKLWMKGITAELFWYLKGDCNLRFLHEHKVHIWDAWANENNEVVNCYPKQWRKWETPEGVVLDQVFRLVDRIQKDPDSRRLIISAWNPGDEDTASLPWCQSFVQFNVLENKLSCAVTMRSSDVFTGLGWNIAFYALFVHMIAHVCNLDVGDLIFNLGNTHLYVNAIDAAKEQLTRKPYALPRLELNPNIKNIDAFSFEDIKLVGYEAHPSMKVGIAV